MHDDAHVFILLYIPLFVSASFHSATIFHLQLVVRPSLPSSNLIVVLSKVKWRLVSLHVVRIDWLLVRRRLFLCTQKHTLVCYDYYGKNQDSCSFCVNVNVMCLFQMRVIISDHANAPSALVPCAQKCLAGA